MVTASRRLPAGSTNASDLRAADFPRTRRGFDPAAVRRFLALVADEVLRLREQLAAAHAETDRIKHNLRQWQTDHATTPTPRRLAHEFVTRLGLSVRRWHGGKDAGGGPAPRSSARQACPIPG